MKFADLWRDGVGFWRVWVVTLGRRHGILEALPRRPAGVAKTPLRLWIDAALALGVVVRRGGRIVPAPGARDLLIDRRHPDYLAGHLMYGALRSLDYDAFGRFFARGATLNQLARPRRLEAIEEATAWDHAMFLRRLPSDVRRKLVRGCDVLELGCGTGAWLRMMRRAFPRSRFEGVDPDPEAGAKAGRAETFGRAGSRDVIYLGEVLHVTDRARTLKNCARVLRPGGKLLVLEGFMPERVSARPMEAVLFAMQLDQALQGVRFMRRSDLKLPGAFSPPKFIRFGGCVALAVATRLG